jgi:phenylpropionate dioxygenase-like ring-hydroxylating dioxygenase large terminal subunit
MYFMQINISMFKNPPRIFAHKTVVEKENFVLPDYILNRNGDNINLFHRYCPHRMYPMHQPGEHVGNIFCKFHGFEWSKDGTPLNNSKKINCGSTTVGRSGLVFKNFVEPDHRWVDELSNETELTYSHSFQGESKGSWLWLMDAEADLLHVYKNGIHPFLSQQVNLEDIKQEQGNDWILQDHPDGWWLYIFPFTFVEYGRPGCVMVNTVIPEDINTEHGFKWITQFYYAPDVKPNTRFIFETLETVFKEDVATAELQKGNYFPLMKAMNKYEDHCVHFGNWVKLNKVD